LPTATRTVSADEKTTMESASDVKN